LFFRVTNAGSVPKGAFKHLWETPCADPHAVCCGGWGLETLGYPIISRSILLKQIGRFYVLGTLHVGCIALGHLNHFLYDED
jgi:hypothetical protein